MASETNINAKLTSAVFLPILAVFTFIFNRRLKLAAKISYQSIADINAQVEDTLSGIRVVQSFANEELEVKFANENHRYMESRKTIYRNETIFYQGVTTFKKWCLCKSIPDII